MKRLAIVSLVLAAMTVPADAAHACEPHLTLDYTTGEATFTWAFDLSGCEAEGAQTEVALTLEVSRTAIGEDTEETYRAATGCENEPICAVEVIAPHPAIERGRYQGTASFSVVLRWPNRTEAIVEAGTFSYGCLSALVAAAC